jgi:uncharacterized protein
MQFIVYCKDKGTGELRQKARADHFRHILSELASGGTRYVFGGPMITDGKIVGSLFIVDAADRAELDRALARDPYFRNDIFASVEIHATRQMVPEPVPGTLQSELDKQLAKDRGG